MEANETERRYLDELLVAMRGPCVDSLSPGLSKVFAREFRATLLIHHYFLKIGFDTGITVYNNKLLCHIPPPTIGMKQVLY